LQTYVHLAYWTAITPPNMPVDITPNHKMVDTDFGSSPLDSLLSPRRSMLSELGEVGMDDESDFSMVPLSARQSTTSIGSNTSVKSTATKVGKENRRRTTVLSLNPSDPSALAKSLHKKSASASSDMSIATNTPFILARLESQKEQDEYGPKTHRASVDGQQKLQAEFVRMQSDIKEEDNENNSTNANIDWGMCHAMLTRSLRLTDF